jgi:predicted DNA-binding protein (MmcQ/YjbR family)
VNRKIARIKAGEAVLYYACSAPCVGPGLRSTWCAVTLSATFGTRIDSPAAMNVKQLQKFCRGLPGASERPWEPPFNVLVYSLDKTNFAYFKTSEPERWRFSCKVTPMRFVELTGIPGVKPARYRGRYHWVTIVDVRNFPADYLKELVQWSHQYALETLSKTRQRELLAKQ